MKPEIFYRLSQTPVMGGLYDIQSPLLEANASWMSGAAHNFVVKLPLTILLIDDFGTRLPDIFDTGALVMSSQLLSVLRKAGVDNIDSYPVVLTDPVRKVIFPDYHAVQVLGCIRAADMDHSDYFDPVGYGQMIDFQRLVIDQEAARGALMFRLHESVATLIVHASVKAELDKTSWSFVTVCSTEEIPLPLILDDEDDVTIDTDDDSI